MATKHYYSRRRRRRRRRHSMESTWGTTNFTPEMSGNAMETNNIVHGRSRLNRTR